MPTWAKRGVLVFTHTHKKQSRRGRRYLEGFKKSGLLSL